MLIGYARISKHEQSLDLQKDALKDAGCDKIYTDIASGAKEDRPQLQKLLSYIREGDTLVVWRLDRLGRSLKHLIELFTNLENRKINFKSLQEQVDTSSPVGKLIFHVFGALAEFERGLIRERTLAGLKAARARGRNGGRPKSLNHIQVKMLQQLTADRKLTIIQLCDQFNISKNTYYKYTRMEQPV